MGCEASEERMENTPQYISNNVARGRAKEMARSGRWTLMWGLAE